MRQQRHSLSQVGERGPMNRDDQPPPMPGSRHAPNPPRHQDGDEPTMMQHGALPDSLDELPDSLDDLPDDLPDQPPEAAPLVSGTGAKVTLRALDEGLGRESTHERVVRQQHNLERRQPVDARKRPTLLPAGMEGPPKLPGSRPAADPALMRPMRPLETNRPVIAQARESSDVIQMFPAGSSAPAPMAQQQRTVAAQPQQPIAQPGGQQGRLVRRPPPQVPGHATIPPQPPRPTSSQLQTQSVLPLSHDRLVVLTAEHRTRLRALDHYARALEIGAGLFGTVALAVLIASLVSLMLGHGQSVVVAGTAIVSAFAGIALTGLMIAAAAGLRQVAHQAAQVGALLEALSQPSR